MACAACVLLAVLTARGIAASAATSVPAGGIGATGARAHFTPRPESVRQLAPPAPAALPTGPTAAALGSDGADDGRRKYSALEGEEGQQLGPPGLLRTITTQVSARSEKSCRQTKSWGQTSCTFR